MFYMTKTKECRLKKKNSLSFPPPWEFQTPISTSRVPDPSLLLGDPRLLINLPRIWLSQQEVQVCGLEVGYQYMDELVGMIILHNLFGGLIIKSCPALCNPIDYSLPGSSAHGILQARTLEWVAISFSRGSSQLRNQTQVSHIPGRFFTIWKGSLK